MKCGKCRNEAEFGVDGEETVLCADCYVGFLRDTLTEIVDDHLNRQTPAILSFYAKTHADQALAITRIPKLKEQAND